MTSPMPPEKEDAKEATTRGVFSPRPLPGKNAQPLELLRFFHEQLHSIDSLIDAQYHILKFLGTDPFSEVNIHNDEKIAEIFAAPLSHLENVLAKMIMHIGKDIDARRIPNTSWKKIESALSELSSIKASRGTAAPFRLREIAIKIRREVEGLRNIHPRPGLNKEQTLESLRAASEVERLASIFDLHRAIAMTVRMRDDIADVVRTHREGQSNEDFSELQRVNEVVQEAINYFKDTADRRGIEIRFTGNKTDVLVKTARVELKKALGNLLDNAIKYTGELPPDSKYATTWIEVRVNSNNEVVNIQIESWGLPVTDEESKGNFIFKEGYRGWYARQTGIEGTGTGLPDVKDFAQKHGGDVVFESTPVRKQVAKPIDVKSTITLSLPRVG